MDGNAYGLFAWSTNATAVLKASVRDSRVVRNTSYGLWAASDAGAAVTLTASNNIVSNNLAGIIATNAGSSVLAVGNTVSANVPAWPATSAALSTAPGTMRCAPTTGRMRPAPSTDCHQVTKDSR
jgi:hypothetical protein